MKNANVMHIERHEYCASRLERIEDERWELIEQREMIRQAAMFLATAAFLAAWWLLNG